MRCAPGPANDLLYSGDFLMAPASYGKAKTDAGRIGGLRRIVRTLSAFVLFFGITVALQWASGSYSSEFGRDPDEPGHYITGLMVRDYIASGFPGSPLRYAENYYLHYPKVAIGHWPPVFYFLQAAWTLLFPVTFQSLLVFMAVLTALLSLSVFETVQSEFGVIAGVSIGALFTLLPLVQTYYKMLMMEIPVALLCYCAAIRFGKYLDTERWQDSGWFGLVAVVAIMTKGNGFALAFLPVFSLLLIRRWHLLRRMSFWLPGFMVAVVCGPWYFLTLGMAANGVSEPFSVHFVTRALSFNLQWLIKLVSVSLSILCAIGLLARIVAPIRRGREPEGRWVAMAALLLSVFLFHSLVPASLDARHLITAAPPLLVFVAAGFSWLRSTPLVGRPESRWKTAVVALFFAALFLAETLPVSAAVHRGYSDVAKDLLSRAELRNSVFLVSSTAGGEGGLISHIAMNEKRPGHFVLRGTKVLGVSEWTGGSYRLRHETPEQVMTYLESIPVRILIIDSERRGGERDHHTLLIRMLEQYPQKWVLSGVFPQRGPRNLPLPEIRTYRLVGQQDKLRPKIKIDMRYTIRREIETQN
jgi:hypothetical protein